MADWINWALGLLTPAQWDAWRNWLATIGALVALSIGALTYRRNVKLKREEQARLVYAKVEHLEFRAPGDQFPTLLHGARMGNGCSGMVNLHELNPSTDRWDLALAVQPILQATVIIHNGSKELVGPARVQLIHGVTREVWDTFSIQIAEIEPESDYVVEFTWINEHHPGFAPAATTIIFRDSSGQWWRRVRSEPIERIHNDPENGALPPKERIAARAMQEASGIPEENRVKEPKVGPIVRWHRLWRRVRGKSPIP